MISMPMFGLGEPKSKNLYSVKLTRRKMHKNKLNIYGKLLDNISNPRSYIMYLEHDRYDFSGICVVWRCGKPKLYNIEIIDEISSSSHHFVLKNFDFSRLDMGNHALSKHMDGEQIFKIKEKYLDTLIGSAEFALEQFDKYIKYDKWG